MAKTWVKMTSKVRKIDRVGTWWSLGDQDSSLVVPRHQEGSPGCQRWACRQTRVTFGIKWSWSWCLHCHVFSFWYYLLSCIIYYSRVLFLTYAILNRRAGAVQSSICFLCFFEPPFGRRAKLHLNICYFEPPCGRRRGAAMALPCGRRAKLQFLICWYLLMFYVYVLYIDYFV